MEKRRHYRLPRSLIARIEWADGECLGSVFNLAKFGIGVFCQRELPVSTAVQISISLSGRRDFALPSRIVRARTMPALSRNKFEYGVALTGDLDGYHVFLATTIRREFEMCAQPNSPDVRIVDHGDVLDLLDVAATNVAAGGLFVRTDRALEVGGEYEVMLRNDGVAEPIYCLGEVVAAFQMDVDALEHPFAAGLRLMAFRGDGQARFAEFLKGLDVLYPLYWQPDASGDN